MPRFVRQTIGRLAIPAHSLIPPGLLGYDPAAVARSEPIAATLTETVVSNVELTVAVSPVFLTTYAVFARELSSAFAAAGVVVRPVTTTMAEFLDATNRGTVDLTMGRWNADYPDPDTFAYFLHSQHGFQGRMCGSPETDRIIQRARVESTPAARHALVR